MDADSGLDHFVVLERDFDDKEFLPPTCECCYLCCAHVIFLDGIHRNRMVCLYCVKQRCVAEGECQAAAISDAIERVVPQVWETFHRLIYDYSADFDLEKLDSIMDACVAAFIDGQTEIMEATDRERAVQVAEDRLIGVIEHYANEPVIDLRDNEDVDTTAAEPT